MKVRGWAGEENGPEPFQPGTVLPLETLKPSSLLPDSSFLSPRFSLPAYFAVSELPPEPAEPPSCIPAKPQAAQSPTLEADR